MLKEIGRCLVVVLAVMMVAWGLGMPLLALTGASAEGKVTDIRRQLGDRGESVPNRYTFQVVYRFSLPDGSVVRGSRQKVGDYFSPRYFRVGQKVNVRYLAVFPVINIVDWRWFDLFEYLTVALVGGVLFYLQVFQRSRKGRKGGTGRAVGARR